MDRNPEIEAVVTVAKLMALAARTAPKSRGKDNLQVAIVTEREEINKLAAQMRGIGTAKGQRRSQRNQAKGEALTRDWHSDARSVEKSDVLLLLGMNARQVLDHDCGGCGFVDCLEFAKSQPLEGAEITGPSCVHKMVDFGIAMGSAAAVAARHFVDNRMMNKLGVAARMMGYLPGSTVVMGIPLSATGKNIFFDRNDKVASVSVLYDGAKH